MRRLRRLLTGPAPGVFEDVHRCRNEMTRLHQRDPVQYPRNGERAFHMNEADVLEAQKLADAEGWLVTGVYHSHADAGAYFSELDQEYARQPGFPFPQAHHVVNSVLDGVVSESALFRRCDEPPGFEGCLLIGGSP